MDIKKNIMSYYLLLIIISSVSWVVSSTLKRKFKKYSRISLRNGMSGSEIAEKMLFDHGITNVKVVCVKGKLTDHYNPKDRTVNLSESVFNKRNAAAAAVAAHECGHAVQHAKAYSWLQLRSAMVPVTSLVSRLSTIVIFIGIAMYFGALLVRGRARARVRVRVRLERSCPPRGSSARRCAPGRSRRGSRSPRGSAPCGTRRGAA